MKIIARILIAIVALATCLGWMLPIGLSLYLTKTAPAIAKVVPTDLADSSISQASGTKLSYFGHEFEVPWSDLNDSES